MKKNLKLVVICSFILDAEESMEVVERNSISAFNLFSYLTESDKDIIECEKLL